MSTAGAIAACSTSKTAATPRSSASRAEAEPQIYACTRRFGTILENVALRSPCRDDLDLNDYTVTENTRAAYPLEYIENFSAREAAGHPNNVIFLTCDASGVMPPISRLSPDQAIYHFISGYTSKIAGTEIGLGMEPEITFSTCFGGPFMVHHPYRYAELLKESLLRHGAVLAGEHGLDRRVFRGGQAYQHPVHTRAVERGAGREVEQRAVPPGPGVPLRGAGGMRGRAGSDSGPGGGVAESRRVRAEVRRAGRAICTKLPTHRR